MCCLMTRAALRCSSMSMELRCLSAAHFWRQQTNPNRLIGNVLIALGAMSPAIGGVLNRFGFAGLYVGELVGAILVFSGFIAITREADLNLRTRRADANR